MDDNADMQAILDAFGEPVMLTDVTGRIHLANTSTLMCFGRGLERLTEICDSAETCVSLLAYLRRCSGVAQALPGSATLRTVDGDLARFRLRCSGLKGAQTESRRLLIRLEPRSDERFAALSSKVKELNDEIRQRRHIQMRLETALHERDLLLRELHHRVKNNIHLLTGIVSAAQRESGKSDARKVLADIAQRLQAVAAVHQLLHFEGSFASVESAEFIAMVAGHVMQVAGKTHNLALDVHAITLSNDVAVPLALILNELLTNAVKHATRPDCLPTQVRVRLVGVEAGKLELVVADDGPGFQPEEVPRKRASGLGLVHGLSRQIDGALVIRQGMNSGVECILQFRDSKAV